MNTNCYYVILCFLIVIILQRVSSNRTSASFPEGFLFGAASSSYQVEGGWDEDGKAESIWDHIVHEKPELVLDGTNGDIACDSYHKYKEDVQMLKFLGVDFYRFSISWPRILPTGFSNVVNQKGIDYYNNLIDELLTYNITPYITLYHWELPQKLQDLGGWTNRLLIDIFADYAKIAFEAFGDRVKFWQTFNEIRQICYDGYGLGFAPKLNMSGFADYQCVHTTLLAHAKVYHMYDQEFRNIQKGRVGMSISSFWFEPASNKSEDIEATLVTQLFETALIADPIFSASGDYPMKLKELIAKKSSEQSFPRSRLPSFTSEEIAYIKGTADFYGLNHYTTFMIKKATGDEGYFTPSLEDDMGGVFMKNDDWPQASTADWLSVVPGGFRSLLNFIRSRYNNPEVLIFENGFSDKGEMNDVERVNYYRLYLEAVLDAIEDGCNITHYTAWSLMDNFEWFLGFSDRFGLFHVDFESPNRTRTPKASALVYKDILRNRYIDFDYNPTVPSRALSIYTINNLFYIILHLFSITYYILK